MTGNRNCAWRWWWRQQWNGDGGDGGTNTLLFTKLSFCDLDELGFKI